MKLSYLAAGFAASAFLTGCGTLENPLARFFHTGHDARTYNSQTGQFEWPEEKKKIDIGSFYTDSTRFRAATGWQSVVDIREGLARTMAFYRAAREHYVDEKETPA